MIKRVIYCLYPRWSPAALQQLVHPHRHSSSNRSSSTACSSFRFAAAASDRGNLFKAIHDVVESVQQQLQGKSIDFCQLLVTTAHRSTLSQAPECLLDYLKACTPTKQKFKCPVIIGGAVQSVTGGGQSITSGPGVSVLAASLPGVELLPFHVTAPTLPNFTEQQWARLLQQRHFDSSSSTGAGCAAILLSAPHFVEVEKLLQRFSNALPGMPVVGGVTEPSAWGDTEHQYGALFCGTDVYCLGAVGCLMLGPISMRQVLLPGYRSSGQMMTVTQALGNHILSLDGQPVHDALVALMHSLPEEDRNKRELLLGLSETQSGTAGRHSTPAAAVDSRQVTARHMSLTTTTHGRPILTVATHEVMVGTRVQLMLRNDDNSNKQQQAAALEALAPQLNPLGNAAAILSYSCAALPTQESIAAEALPQVPHAGGTMQGEFAGPDTTWLNTSHNPNSIADTCRGDPTAAAMMSDSSIGQPGCAKLHSYATSYAVLHHKT